jgi:hypothetical protein
MNKICRVCQNEYPLERFSKGRTKCKNCYAKDKREKQQADPENINKRVKNGMRPKGKNGEKNMKKFIRKKLISEIVKNIKMIQFIVIKKLSEID